MSMKDRIVQIMKKEGLTNAEFAEKISISTSSLSHIFSGRNNPSLEVVMRIHKACPYVNLNWLLYGEGEMEAAPESTTNISGMGIYSGSAENSESPTDYSNGIEFRKENASEGPNSGIKEVIREEVKYIEKPTPKITEIRIFFDNGTYQVFKAEK